MTVYFYGCVSMDGYLADKDHGLSWLHESGTLEETDYEDFYRQMDVTIMGRRTFDEVAKLGNPAAFYPTTQNLVFTHDRDFQEEGFEAKQGSIVDVIAEFSKDTNIWLIGGNGLMAELLEHDMVDELIIQVAPVLLGAGIPLFSQKEKVQCFTLVDVKKYGAFAQMTYRK
ncbi:dihydrofolate reductase family protein [Streptococcus pneumoniae]